MEQLYAQLIDTATLLYIKQHSLVLEIDAIMKSWRAAVGS